MGENTLSHVHGHQVNGTINAGTVSFNAGQATAKRTEYDEFEYVKRGHIASMKEIHSEDFPKWDWELQNGELFCRRRSSAQRSIYTVELVDRQSKFTVMIYKGKDAHGIWEKDFKQFSKIKNPDSVRLFGINRSAIPALIFHHELIPLGHIFTGSIWMDLYIEHLSRNMECHQRSLWMNTTNDVLCSGPDGPHFRLRTSAIRSIIVPRTVDMLKDDTSFRFFSKFGSSMDDIVLACAQLSGKLNYLDDLFPVTTDHRTEGPDHPAWISPAHPYIRGLWRNLPHHLPMNDIGGLRFNTVYSSSMEAVARRPQEAGSLWGTWKCYRGDLVDGTVLDGELTRFKFDPTRGGWVCLKAEYRWWEFQPEWLLQSCRVFDALDVTEGEDNLFMIDPPKLMIRDTPGQYESFGAFFNLYNGESSVEETQPPAIYLFLRPFPTTISELAPWMTGRFYFWSLDETGQCEMSEKECEWWGLPVLTTVRTKNPSVDLHSWPTSTYTALRDWQKARGFDPTTSDWARESGYPEWEIVDARKSNISLRKLLSFKTAGGSLWEAFGGSGISACGL